MATVLSANGLQRADARFAAADAADAPGLQAVEMSTAYEIGRTWSVRTFRLRARKEGLGQLFQRHCPVERRAQEARFDR